MKQLLSFSLLSVLLAACSSAKPIEVSGFPLEQGTTWVYSYEAYDPSPADPEQIIKANYELTETIVATTTASEYLIAHVQRDRILIHADPGWVQDVSSQPNEFWYLRKDQQVFESNLPVNEGNIQPERLILNYQFPLTLGRHWCLLSDAENAPKEIAGCDFVGKREVTEQTDYETPAGKFENCYNLVDYYNGGNILQTFCDGVGVVFMKFDHSGTRFGFAQTLIRFSKGTP